MTDKELKRLSRAELIDMMIELINENTALRKELTVTQQRLSDKNIAIEQSGSLAEAALKLNGVFEAAQKACDQYLYNLKTRSGIEENTEDNEHEKTSDC